MRYRLRTPKAFITALSLLAITAAGCAGGSDGKEVMGDTPGKPLVKDIATQIVIDNFTFNPPTLTIASGTKVTWVNHDDVPHTATSTAKPRQFHSGTLDTDEKYSFVFTAPGTYDYFCAVHPKMTGQIIVK
jgi:plastocyanin